MKRLWIPVLLAMAPAGLGDDWPQFRGPNRNGVVDGLQHPLEWSDSANIAWTANLAGTGWSSPIIVGRRLFVTTAAGAGLAGPNDMTSGVADPRSMGMGGRMPDGPITFALHCFDVESGSLLWSQIVDEGAPKIPVHPSNTYATETPTADAERVFVYFGTTGLLACFRHSGDKLWERRLPVRKVANDFGTGSSPVLAQGKLYLAQYSEDESFLLALDPGTGEEIWSASLSPGSSWATPLVWDAADQVVACGANTVTGHDLESGSVLWTMFDLTSAFSASPAALGDLVYFGNGGPGSDSPLIAVRSAARGDVTLDLSQTSSKQVAFRVRGTEIGMASPLIYEGCAYVASDGRLRVFDAASGEEAYRQRLPDCRIIVSSPWAGDGKVFFTDESGKTFVIKAGREFELLGTNQLSGLFWASAAISGKRLVLRDARKLVCIAPR